MSDVNLLTFGCVVSFIAAAGGYVYLRTCWDAERPSREPDLPLQKADQEVREVA